MVSFACFGFTSVGKICEKGESRWMAESYGDHYFCSTVSIKSNSIRLSAEEKSATNAGSFVIWVAMTLALTTLSIFLASNHLSFFDDRTADGEGGTGVSSTTYERWSLSTRLCCQRRYTSRLTNRTISSALV